MADLQCQGWVNVCILAGKGMVGSQWEKLWWWWLFVSGDVLSLSHMHRQGKHWSR